LKCKSSVPRLKRPVTMSIFRCRWQRRLDWRAGRKFSGNCWSGVNYAWCDLRFQPPAKIGRSQRSVKVGFDTLSWASHPSESGNSPLKSGLSLHLLAGHHEIIGLGTWKALDVTPERLEQGLRLAYLEDDFSQTRIFGQIRQWEASHMPFRIFRSISQKSLEF